LGAGAAVAVSAIAIIIIRFIQRKRMIPWVAIICVLAAVVLTYAFASPVRARLNDQASRLANSLRHFQPPTDQYTFEGTSLTLTDDDGGSMTIVAVPAGSDSFCLNEVYVLDAGGKRVEQASESDSGQYTTRKYDVPGFGFIVIDQFADHFRFRGILFAVYTDQLLPIYKDKKPALTEDSVNAIGFKGYETWASGRGYIWSRSLPLMQRYPIIGSGPDSFVNEFPQRDVIGKQKYQDGNPYITVDKAHSLYIQTAVTTGGVSMLAVLILLLFYLVIAFASLISDARNPAKNPKDSPSDSFFSESYAMRIALLASVSAFAVSSMATDSTVATMSVFWIILGMGYGLEIMRQGSKIDDHGQNLKNQRIGVI